MGISPKTILDNLLKDGIDSGVFARENELGYPDDDIKQMAFTRLQHSILKKFVDGESRDAEKRAYDLWIQCNDRCKDWKYAPDSSLDELLFGELKRAAERFIYNDEWDDSLSWSILTEHGRPGPGVTRGTRYTDMYTKLFASNLTATSDVLHRLYRRTLQHPRHQLADKCRDDSWGSEVVAGSVLSFVPKTQKIRRSICVEPSLNQVFQLGFGAVLEARLRQKAYIDLSVQPELNRSLTKVGSQTGRFATIDLSSASDTISLRLVRLLFAGSKFLGMIEQLRSPATEYRGIRHELFMVSSMGNGFTFPLETLIFWCVIQAAYRVAGVHMYTCYDGGRLRPGNYGVFGDDIVVDQQVYRYVVRLLTLCGFLVNDKKSFFEGSFRESCGVEFLNGIDIRGVYIKTLRKPQNVYVAINRLNVWSAEHGIPLERTVKYLLGHVRFLPVPFSEADDAGVRVPYHLVPKRCLVWSRRFQNYGFYAMVAKPFHISHLRYVGGQLFNNPDGLLLTALYGAYRGEKLTVRRSVVRYSRKLRWCPYWDSHWTVPGRVLGQDGWQRWVTAVEFNVS